MTSCAPLYRPCPCCLQIKLLERYKLQHEVVGAEAEARLRILPRVNAPA